MLLYLNHVSTDTGLLQTVPQIDNFLNFFRVTLSFHSKIQIIVIQDTGHVAIDDSYMIALAWQKQVPRVHVSKTSLREHLSRPIFDEIDSCLTKLPDKCGRCAWVRYCKGGDLENRYSVKNGFNNESRYCEGLLKFYEHMAAHLIRAGYPPSLVSERLHDFCKVDKSKISPGSQSESSASNVALTRMD